MRIVITSGGMDPIHSGHLKYLNAAKQLGDKFVILLNSNDWLTAKKGKPFMPFGERKAILKQIYPDADVQMAHDSDGTVIPSLLKLREIYPLTNIYDLIFAKGGDRTPLNTPELQTCIDNNIMIIFGVGGFDKKVSSSQFTNGIAPIK